MKNFKFYKDEILEACDNGNLSTFIWNKAGINTHALYSENNMIRWLYEEHKEEILTKSEKDYLSSTLHPFKDRLISISKNTFNLSFDSIAVRMKSQNVIGMENVLNFPPFKKGTMYKNMEIGLCYTPEELELWN